jgi:hypothetical protein
MRLFLLFILITLLLGSFSLYATSRDFQYEIVNGGSRGNVVVLRNVPGTVDQWQSMDSFSYPQYNSFVINRYNTNIGFSTKIKATVTRSDNGQSKTVIQDIVPGLNYVLLEFTIIIVPGPDPVPKGEGE